LRASEHYKTQPVNVVNQKWHADGTVTIRIYKAGWKRAYQFKIRNLGKPNEEVIEDEEIRG